MKHSPLLKRPLVFGFAVRVAVRFLKLIRQTKTWRQCQAVMIASSSLVNTPVEVDRPLAVRVDQ
jgi:hypothetical protein